MYAGETRVKYAGGKVRLGSRIVLAHVEGDGSQIQEQVTMTEGGNVFELPPQDRMTSRDWLLVIAALGFVAGLVAVAL